MKLQIGVKILLKNNSGQFLMLRRTEKVDHGGEAVWDIPGGRISDTEPLSEALSRELLEETGLILSDEPKLLAAQDIFVGSKDLHVVRLTYLGRSDGMPRLSEEHDNYRWLSTEEINQTFNLDPYIKGILTKF